MSSFFNIFKKPINFLKAKLHTDPTQLTSQLRNDIENHMEDDETLLFSSKALSTTHIASSFLDRNTFFSPYFILTNKKIRLAKNSSRLDLIREIDLREIKSYHLENMKQKHKLTLNLFDCKDIVFFPSYSNNYINNLKNLISKAFNEVKTSLQDFLFCRYCGEKIHADSSFCHNCGKKL